MASSNTVSKPVRKILDSTKFAALSKFVRQPEIDPQTPIQGKPREPSSNAFKEYQRRESVRLQKALNSLSHGRNIFVYHNVRTKQVVYSLTRYLEKSNILRQMVYHGKKTVPAEFRRDMWVPYYSVHFAEPRLGLRAYKLLREFSMQRQLAPPPEMITVTEEYLALKRPRDPVGAEEFDQANKRRIGQPMEKKERARVLMDQKATSVADIAAVLAIQEEAEQRGLFENGHARGYLNSNKDGYLTPAVRRNRRAFAMSQGAKLDEYNSRVLALEQELSERSGEPVMFEERVMSRRRKLELEVEERKQRKMEEKMKHDGIQENTDPEQAIADGEQQNVNEEPSDVSGRPEMVKILWQDLHDANYAVSWPKTVEHGILEIKRSYVIGSEKQAEYADEVYSDEIISDNEFTERKAE
ncbi:uncharacterized protein N7459_003265 [Penicillium hispanicum]|uniref:uncharacterized protein n=1 Tax=Penicillium hispanicum TaxID=1080232 RepID=UPI0025421CAD|nr:uncharacterized protein N7459_003265 [Penicillium hispanicum]KAJ5587500.1 hypothetical protein N7459_003265 [Penicillium hispanicum]